MGPCPASRLCSPFPGLQGPWAGFPRCWSVGPPGTEPLAGSGPVGWASAVSRPLGPVSGALGSDPITSIDCHLQMDTVEFILVIFTAVLKHRYDFLRVLLEEIGFQKATCLASSGKQWVSWGSPWAASPGHRGGAGPGPAASGWV